MGISRKIDISRKMCIATIFLLLFAKVSFATGWPVLDPILTIGKYGGTTNLTCKQPGFLAANGSRQFSWEKDEVMIFSNTGQANTTGRKYTTTSTNDSFILHIPNTQPPDVGDYRCYFGVIGSNKETLQFEAASQENVEGSSSGVIAASVIVPVVIAIIIIFIVYCRCKKKRGETSGPPVKKTKLGPKSNIRQTYFDPESGDREDGVRRSSTVSFQGESRNGDQHSSSRSLIGNEMNGKDSACASNKSVRNGEKLKGQDEGNDDDQAKEQQMTVSERVDKIENKKQGYK